MTDEHILCRVRGFGEGGKPPVRLRAGDSLLVPTGTIHSHWNPSSTDRLRFLEFIVAEKGKGRSIPEPTKTGTDEELRPPESLSNQKEHGTIQRNFG